MSNYPAGAKNDPRAPYNQVTPEAKKFDVCISETLSKSTIVFSNDYTVEQDEEGDPVYDTSNICWISAFKEQHYTIEELLKKCSSIIKKLAYNEDDPKKVRKYYKILSEIHGWVPDEIEIIEE